MGLKDASGRARDVEPGFGPAITSFIRRPDALDGTGATGRGAYIEDAIVPDFLSWTTELAWPPSVLKRALRFLWFWWRSRGKDTDMSHEVSQLLTDDEFASASLPLLAMGRDVPSGRMRLNGKWLEVDWAMAPNESYYRELKSLVERLAEQLGGEVKFNSTGRKRTFTVHPLGGCAMGENPGEGVVDARGRVFDQRGGVIDGLYVADGSVMPGPVGPNPSLTIAAMADHFADGILAEP
jgi:cholesterol oxidase